MTRRGPAYGPGDATRQSPGTHAQLTLLEGPVDLVTYRWTGCRRVRRGLTLKQQLRLGHAGS